MKARMIVAVATAAAIGFGVSGLAEASVLTTWTLGNKNKGAENPPNYGLRIDNLFGTSGANLGGNWTFDFEDTVGTGVTMQTLDDGFGGIDIRIFGTVFGGRDVGTEWATGSTGYWGIDFTYTAAVEANGSAVPTDGGEAPLVVDRIADGGAGGGALTYIGDASGNIVDLIGSEVDESLRANGGDLSIALGADSGNKAFAFCYGDIALSGCGVTTVGGQQRLKGSGWLTHGVGYDSDALVKNGTHDFGITGTRQVPEPASLALLALGLVGAAGVRAVHKTHLRGAIVLR